MRWLAAMSLACSAAAAAPPLKPAYDVSLPREERIRLAESAAPTEVSGKATVYVLERTGYAKVRDGTNGFTCLVDRETPWNCEPSCFDAEGTATTVPARIFVEALRAQGKNEEEVKAALDEGYKSGRFKAPRKGGIVYMLSDSNYLRFNDKILHGPPHLMFYAPYATDKDIGSPPPGIKMPMVIHAGRPDAYIIAIPGNAEHAAHG
jgi:hypothetical protein